MSAPKPTRATPSAPLRYSFVRSGDPNHPLTKERYDKPSGKQLRLAHRTLTNLWS